MRKQDACLNKMFPNVRKHLKHLTDVFLKFIGVAQNDVFRSVINNIIINCYCAKVISDKNKVLVLTYILYRPLMLKSSIFHIFLVEIPQPVVFERQRKRKIL